MLVTAVRFALVFHLAIFCDLALGKCLEEMEGGKASSIEVFAPATGQMLTNNLLFAFSCQK